MRYVKRVENTRLRKFQALSQWPLSIHRKRIKTGKDWDRLFIMLAILQSYPNISNLNLFVWQYDTQNFMVYHQHHFHHWIQNCPFWTCGNAASAFWIIRMNLNKNSMSIFHNIIPLSSQDIIPHYHIIMNTIIPSYNIIHIFIHIMIYPQYHPISYPQKLIGFNFK